MATTPTAAQAQDLIWRSMTTGVSSNEFDRYGGYDAVATAYKAAGGGYSRDEIPAAMKTQLAQQIANTGVGNLGLLADTGVALTEAGRNAMTANGVTNMDAAFLDSRKIPYQKTAGEQVTGLQRQIDLLTTNYNNLVAAQNKSPTAGGSTVNAGGTTVDTGGSTVNAGGTTAAPTGTTGVVYGPDGVMYSSAAAAIAAGVNNYTTTKPAGLITTNNTLGGQFTNAAAGNVNPGGLIGNAQKQLFQNPVTVQGPSVKTTNPFALTR